MTRSKTATRPGAACLAAVWIAVWLGACTGGGHKPPPPSTDIDENGFRNDVRMLASDEFEGRRPGTPGEERTVGFLVEQFRRYGLKPGVGDSFLQPVPLVEIAAGDATLAVEGHGGARRLEYARDMVIWSPREVSEASLQKSELVFVGYGIVAPEYEWNDYRQADVHGKTVVVMVGDPGYGSKDPQVFRGNAETYYGRWSYKVAEAGRQGAAGVLLIHDAGAAGSSWNVVVNDRAGPQVSAPAADGDGGHAAIEGWITLGAARGLFKQAGLDFESLTTAAARPGFKATAMGLEADATVHSLVRRFTSSNVVALLPGTNHRREVVAYTAHWDQLGRRGGDVFHGAVNDASGVAGLLMLAQSFSRTRPGPDRSIAFVAFTAGETGLLQGSEYFVRQPTFSLRETAAVLNLDLLRNGGPTRDVMVFGYGNSELEDYLRESALLQGREVHPDPSPEQGFYYRSDAFSFAKIGVPALYAVAGLDDSARGPAYGRQQFGDYLARRYHQPDDVYAADWDVRGSVEDLQLYYEVGLRLAHSRRFPRFYPNSEFRLDRGP